MMQTNIILVTELGDIMWYVANAVWRWKYRLTMLSQQMLKN